ncbi:MAG: hypothetical protein A2233_05510 [Candidatus Kerfeldbacteria bacterium RIFOXYA2_FULL_38_24]|uniref:Uncharacterized protein n=1 Tax=Candidatus Kerfeldbacteria bacterium RIFOXYB2_FULL_38_14 TaxID=1798547 RepID=A0A1G2BGD9_9BACT|nr:MAG: hypothetical protein A2233_05510 [Candidatus Kerfeldbacteria bacterium RIFOXYA2_FULL_38_24]OGY88283.1 MAG: hypothetical protein A2319_03795 [Candidatus Kerfeldbacteria bacterium RIFOXYB2_FULL_38_14]OGY89742.1 MAG: hypothetical protein A2458_01635 [Candidatus Kerfeldbacteria bacterium RIFOXYC2_FULL_38_9]
MTRRQLENFFPDTYNFFAEVFDKHPFWQAVFQLSLDEAKNGETLLSDLERIFSSLRLLDNHRVLKDHLEDIHNHDELMAMLTSLYMAYLYREHHPRLISGKHGYDLELQVADQLIAMGVVQFKNFEPLQIQFAPQIEDEMQHWQAMQENEQNSTELFFHHLKKHARKLKEHPQAKHQIMAAITKQSALSYSTLIDQHVKKHQTQMQENFPHLAGIVLVDPRPGKERAKFIPFHGEVHELEMLLQKNSN